MGCSEHLKRMLRPLGVYKLRDSYSSGELEAIGYGLDLCEKELDTALASAVFDTADEKQVKKLEQLLPIVNFKSTLSERLAAVKTLFSADETFSGKEALEKLLDACGAAAKIVETDSRFIVELHFSEIRGEPDDTEKQVCRAIMPAHIALRYICAGLTWDRAEALFPKWNDFDSSGYTADEIMKLE